MTPETVAAVETAVADAPPRPAAAEAGPGTIAIYTRAGKTGTLLGLVTETQWAQILERRLKIDRFDASALQPDGTIAATVRDLDDARTARIETRIADIDARIANLQARRDTLART